MRPNSIAILIVFLLSLAAQVFLFNNMVLFGTAFCFVYIAFILFIPFKINQILLMAIAFAGGLVTDLFYDSMGMNAAAMVFVAFIRRYWVSFITPRGGYEEILSPTDRSLGLLWFIYYIFPLALMHHLVLFQVEAGEIWPTWYIFKKVFFSAIFTSSVLILIRNLFYRGSRKI
jgi:hypothetical protein